MTSGIYIATNKVNGRRYIGYSANIEARWQEYTKILDRGPSKNHPLIYQDMQANGFDAFCFGILQVMDTQEPSLLNRQAEYWRGVFKPEYNNKSTASQVKAMTYQKPSGDPSTWTQQQIDEYNEYLEELEATVGCDVGDPSRTREKPQPYRSRIGDVGDEWKLTMKPLNLPGPPPVFVDLSGEDDSEKPSVG